MARQRIGRLTIEVDPDFDEGELRRQIREAVTRKPIKIKLTPEITAKDVNQAIREVNRKKLTSLKIPVEIRRSDINRALREARTLVKGLDVIDKKRVQNFNRAKKEEVSSEKKAADQRKTQYLLASKYQDSLDRKRTAWVKAELAAQTKAHKDAIKAQTVLDKLCTAEFKAQHDRMRAIARRPIVFSNNLDKVNNSLRGLERQVVRTAKVGTLAFAGFNAAVVAGVAAAVTAAVVQFARAEKAAAQASSVFAAQDFIDDKKIRAQVESGKKSFLELADVYQRQLIGPAKRIALETVFDTGEILTGFKALAQAGVPAGAAIKQMGVVAKFAQNEGIALDDAVRTLTTGFQAAGFTFDTQSDKLQNLADKFTFVANRSTTTAEEVSQAFSRRAVQAFRAYGASTEDAVNQTLALTDLFARIGRTGKTAGEQIGIIVREVNRAAFTKSPEVFKRLGIDIGTVDGKAVPFTKTLAQLSLKLKEARDAGGAEEFTKLKKELGLTEKASGGLLEILPLVTKLGVKGFSDLADQVNAASGTIDRQSSVIQNTISFQFEAFQNSISNLAITFSQSAGPIIIGFLKDLNKEGSGLSERLEPTIRHLGIRFAEIAENVTAFLASSRGGEAFKDIGAAIRGVLRGVRDFGREFARAFSRGRQPQKNFFESFSSLMKAFGEFSARVAPKIGRALGTIFGFIRDNYPALRRMTKAVVAFFIAFKLARLIAAANAGLAAYKIKAAEAAAANIALAASTRASAAGSVASTAATAAAAGGAAAAAGRIGKLALIGRAATAALGGPVGLGIAAVSVGVSLFAMHKATKATNSETAQAVDHFYALSTALSDVRAGIDSVKDSTSKAADVTSSLVSNFQKISSITKTRQLLSSTRVKEVNDLLDKQKGLVQDILDIQANRKLDLTSVTAGITVSAGEIAGARGDLESGEKELNRLIDLRKEFNALDESDPSRIRHGLTPAGRLRGQVEALGGIKSLNDLIAIQEGQNAAQTKKIADAEKLINDLKREQTRLNKTLFGPATKEEARAQRKLTIEQQIARLQSGPPTKAGAARIAALEAELKGLNDQLQRNAQLVRGKTIVALTQELNQLAITAPGQFEAVRKAILDSRSAIDGLVNTKPEIKTFVSTLQTIGQTDPGKKLLDTISPRILQLVEKFKSGKVSINQIIKEFGNTTSSKKFLTQLGIDLDSAKGIAKRKGRDVGTTFASSVSDGVKSLFGGTKTKDAFGNNTLTGVMFGGAAGGVQKGGPVDQAKEAGKQISKGMASGITSQTEFIKTEFRSTNNKVLASVRKDLGIQSPSTVYRDMVGKHIGTGLVDGINAGIRSYLNVSSPLGLVLKDITQFIRDHKGPVEYDRTILVPAGEAIMDGLVTGLSHGFNPLKAFLRRVGPSMEEFVPDSLFLKRSAEFLLDYKNSPNPDEFFADMIPQVATFPISGNIDPSLSFLHKSASLKDTSIMAQKLAKLFGLSVTATKYDHSKFTSSGNISDHFMGTAADLSNGSRPTPQMDALAAAVKPLFGSIFKQLIYRQGDLNTGAPIGGHMNHVHLAWLMAKNFSLDSGRIGGPPAIAGQFGQIFMEAAKRFGISSNLLQAVTKAESNFNPRAGSGAGAKGLMQLLPSTFLAQHVGNNIFDPRQNIFAGAKYLSQQLRAFGDVRLALAAYNAGPGAVSMYHGVPPFGETQAYVKRVLEFLKGFGGFRQMGGSVDPRRSFMVGEAGPEIFVPRRNGFILSNDRIDRLIQLMEQQARNPVASSPTYNVQSASKDPEVLLALMEAHSRRKMSGVL